MFPKIKVTVVLKLALLASHMNRYATALIENLRKTSKREIKRSPNTDAKHSWWPFLSSDVFYIVFVKRIKWCITPFIIEQNKTQMRDCLRNMNKVQWKTTYNIKLFGEHFDERVCVNSRSLARSIGDDDWCFNAAFVHMAG